MLFKEKCNFNCFDIALTAVITFIVLIPVLPAGPLSWSHNLARVAQMPVLVLAALCFVLQKYKTGVSCGWNYFAFTCFCLAILSCFHAEYFFIGLREVTLTMGLIAVAFLVNESVRRGRLRLLLFAVTVAWALYAASCLTLMGAVLATGKMPNSWLLLLGFDNPRFLNHAQTVAIPLLIGIASQRGISKKWHRLNQFALVMSFVLLWVSLGRATFVALTIATALSVFFLRGRTKDYLRELAKAALLGSIVYACLFVLLPTVLGGRSSSQIYSGNEMLSDHSRFYLWQRAVNFISTDLWLGIGPMHFAHFPNLKGAHPHNIYLQIAAEYGLPFALLVICGLGYAFGHSIKWLRVVPILSIGDYSLTVGVLIACLAALIDGAFSGNFVMPVAQIWIAIAAGLFLSTCRVAVNAPRQAYGRSCFKKIFGFILLASQVWLATITFIEVRQDVPQVGLAKQSVNVQSATWWPRYWMDGWF